MVIKKIGVVVLAVPQGWVVELQSKYLPQILTLNGFIVTQSTTTAHSTSCNHHLMHDKKDKQTSIRSECTVVGVGVVVLIDELQLTSPQQVLP